MPDPEYFGSMVWAGVEDIQLRLGDDTHELNYSQLQARNPELRPETDQFKTTFINGSVKTEGKKKNPPFFASFVEVNTSARLKGKPFNLNEHRDLIIVSHRPCSDCPS